MGKEFRESGGPGQVEAQGFNRFFRQAGWDRVVSSRIVCNSPCYLLNLTLCSDAAGVGTGNLYDGNSVAGRRMIDLQVLNGDTLIWQLKHPIFFSNGIFVVIGSNITSMLVHYLPIPE